MLARGTGIAGLLCVLLLAAMPGVAQDDELDDILGGFEDEDPGFEVDRDAIAETDERWWDLSGSVEVSASVNYRSHTSAAGTDYGGLQRLRNRLNLQFDAELPAGWKARIEGWAFYDLAYLLNGRSGYTEAVRNEYEFDWDLREVYLYGKLHDHVDLKLGRQIVIWGRSETLRVLDVLNPLDNREPGRVDLEDLRRPLGMARVDGFLDEWTLSAIAIPEIRFDLNPTVGSDFLPVPPPGLPPEHEPDSFESWELAGSLTGTFSGWDVSLHGAWFFDDQARADDFGPNPTPPPAVAPRRLSHDRLWMLGAGGNYTVGSWLLKSELAYLDGFEFERSSAVGFQTVDKSRLDVLLGVEYYGFVDTSISLEGVNRYVLGHGGSMSRAFTPAPETEQEVALRITRDFLNERLEVTALGVLISEQFGDPALIARLGADYELRDALVVGGGILVYGEGDFGPFDTWGKNDRFFFSLKWSF